MRYLFCLAALFSSLILTPAWAQPVEGLVDEVVVPAGAGVDTDLDHKPDAEAVAAQVAEAVAAVKAIAGTKSEDQASRAMAIAAAVAASLKVLLSILKLFSGVFRRRHIPRIAALVVGLGIFVAMRFAAGEPWWVALIAAGGGPGSILLHELTKLRPGSGSGGAPADGAPAASDGASG